MQEQATTANAPGLDGLGPRLAELIAMERINQNEFAARIGASASFVSDVVRGAKRPGSEFLVTIRQQFGVSVDWLLTGDGAMYGGDSLNVDFLRLVLVVVEATRRWQLEQDADAQALILALQSTHMDVPGLSHKNQALMSRLIQPDSPHLLAVALYNANLSVKDPYQRLAVITRAAIAHYQSARPADWAMAMQSSSTKVGETGIAARSDSPAASPTSMQAPSKPQAKVRSVRISGLDLIGRPTVNNPNRKAKKK